MAIAAATESGGLFSALPLFALLLVGVALFRWIRKSKSMTEPKLDKLERELDLIKNQILLVTTDDLPGIRIAKTLGYIEALSPTEAASDWEYRLAEKDALLRLAKKARDIGANAVVGIRKTNAHYDHPTLMRRDAQMGCDHKTELQMPLLRSIETYTCLSSICAAGASLGKRAIVSTIVDGGNYLHALLKSGQVDLPGAC